MTVIPPINREASAGRRSGSAGAQERINYKTSLNPAQYEAVVTIEEPILVVAGAGSGKTRTLVYKVAYLVEQGFLPESILLLTFTRKAAGEMLQRAQNLVGEHCARVAGGTFHSLAHILLRQYADVLGYKNTFGVMDRGDMEELLGQLRKQSKLGDKDRRFPKRSTLATLISKAANKGLPLPDLMEQDYIHLLNYAKDIKELAKLYTAFKKENSLFDFDDLLIQLNRLLLEHPPVRESIAARYQYIMVDEYQDTNPVQAEIVTHLGSGHGKVMVVGDDAQSIYSFRGASFKNIMEFPNHFPAARIIRLEENYRSRQPILDLTNFIISKAREKYDKKLFTIKSGGEKPRLLTVGTQTEQTLFVCSRIRELIDQGIEPSRIAVLFRAARHSFKLEIELAGQGIEYVKYGGRRFLEAAHIKDLLSILRVVANPSDALSLTRVLLLLEGIGHKGAANIVRWVDGRREQLLVLKDYPAKSKVVESIRTLAELMQKIAAPRVGLQERLDQAWEFYRPILINKYDDYPSRMADIKEFLTLAQDYTNLQQFLTDMALEPPNASGPNPDQKGQKGRVTLSTVHSAKGLEWHTVFIIWATEGRFPPHYALDSPESVDEERRLMYVAATRAEENLYLISPLELDFEGGGYTKPRPSRFIADVPPGLLAMGLDKPSPQSVQSRPSAGQTPKKKSTSPVSPTSAQGLRAGDRVTHPVFGLGQVVRTMDGRKIRIEFDHFGPKILHLDYAGLKRAE